MHLMTKKETVISGIVALVGFGVGFCLNQIGVQKIAEEGIIIHPVSMMLTFSALFSWFIYTMRFEELVKEGSQIKNMITPAIITLLSLKGYDWFPERFPMDAQGQLVFGLLLVTLSVHSIFTGKFRPVTQKTD